MVELEDMAEEVHGQTMNDDGDIQLVDDMEMFNLKGYNPPPSQRLNAAQDKNDGNDGDPLEES